MYEMDVAEESEIRVIEKSMPTGLMSRESQSEFRSAATARAYTTAFLLA